MELVLLVPRVKLHQPGLALRVPVPHVFRTKSLLPPERLAQTPQLMLLLLTGLQVAAEFLLLLIKVLVQLQKMAGC